MALTALLLANGIGSGLFAAPNSAAMMYSVPAFQRGAASWLRGGRYVHRDAGEA